MKGEIIEKAYYLAKDYFKNTQILSLEELIYLLNDSQPLSEVELENVRHWHEDFFLLAYLDKLPIETTELFIGKKQYYKTINNNFSTLNSFILSNQWQLHAEIICYRNKQSWNYNHPFVSFFLKASKKTYRATFIHCSLSPNKKSSFFFRTISTERFPISHYSNSYEQTELLKQLVASKANILVAGSTGSGKTSFISSLLEYIPENEHLVLLEDTKEILPSNNTTELLAENKIGKSLKSLCEYSLRMSPDRLIIGEIRGAEVIPFLLMMNTGHKGLMSSIHSNSAAEALTRCAFLFTMYGESKTLDSHESLKMITQNIHYVVYLQNKKISQVIKVLGSEKQHCFFEEVTLTPPPQLDQ